jgi:hypothetical protein
VDRLTTGRRHVRVGSVTVTELLTKQASSPAHCTDSSPTELDDATDTIAVVPATHRRPTTKAAQLAKLATLGVATAVLCGAVAVASMIAHQRREAAQPSTRPTVRITGEQALLPDQLNKTPLAAVAPTSVHPPVAAASPEVTQQTATDPLTSQDVSSGTTASAGTAQIGAASDLDLVREFYENLPASPTSAFELLSSDLLNTSLGEFLESWSTIHAVDGLDVVQRADGVLATVRLRLADGSHLRIQQLLTVAESPRRIVGVQLLSAQHN